VSFGFDGFVVKLETLERKVERKRQDEEKSKEG
jgi:hypothetical protein